MPIVKFPEEDCAIELPMGSALTAIEDESYGDGLIPFGCRAGSCGACVVEIVHGMESLESADASEIDFLEDLGFSPASHRLACLCIVRADMSLSVASSGE